MTTTKRQRIDPATKAQAALDVGKRKLAALDVAIAKAEAAMADLKAQRPRLATEVDYLADHPALKVPTDIGPGDAA